MKKISWVTHPQYDIPLPKNHKFTSSKFSDLLRELEKSGLSEYANIFYPEKAAISDLLKVHDRNYIYKKLNESCSKHSPSNSQNWKLEVICKKYCSNNNA